MPYYRWVPYIVFHPRDRTVSPVGRCRIGPAATPDSRPGNRVYGPVPNTVGYTG